MRADGTGREKERMSTKAGNEGHTRLRLRSKCAESSVDRQRDGRRGRSRSGVARGQTKGTKRSNRSAVRQKVDRDLALVDPAALIRVDLVEDVVRPIHAS